MEQHARSLAAAQPVSPDSARGVPLAGRLGENATVLLASHRAIARAVAEGGAITPAAEWLLDNYYLVERQIDDVRADLPPGYYRQLPKLAAGPFARYPRVFGLAWAFVAHTDSRFDPELLSRYVRAYQEVQPLSIGELWALAITLRIVLIENLRRIAEAIVRSRIGRAQADKLADRLLGVGGTAAEPAPSLLAEHARTPLADAFAVQLTFRLRDQDPRVTPALDWLGARLAAQGTTADVAVHDEHQRQGAASVTVRNIITSLRLISDVDWPETVEGISLVNDVLATAATFREMDFPTRNLYRTAVETLARGSDRTELEVARAAVQAAARAAASAADARQADPGYHLLAGGRRAFEAAIGYRPSWRAWPAQVNRACGLGGYAGAILAVAACLLVAPLLVLGAMGLAGRWLGLLGVLGAIPASDLAVALVNRAAIWGIGATLLPALELRAGVPLPLRTIVVVPSLLTTPQAIAEQVGRLEVHHLASPGGELVFALLSDWPDAATEQAEGDAALLATAAAGVARLNRQYGPTAAGDRFLLLHRRRVWNASEGQWIGWERKRGKLHELNRLLRGATDTTFIAIDGHPPVVPDAVRYVLTLDADTRLPREAVRRLIGKMAHPLNRPRFDPVAGRVVEGHGVMQPRVSPSLPVGREGSLFQRSFSALSGIDPYASAVSDVYQDLFDEGSYAGKGIYDVDAFAVALAGRVPDSTMLSHDLFEGVFARAALASDIEVVEEFPARYDVDALRRHRWARGDWQLLPWVLGRARRQGAMPAIGRWKMLDNLRRTLSAPAAVLALLVGWALPFDAAAVWTCFVTATIVLPTLIPVLTAILPRRAGITPDSHLRALGGDLGAAATQSFLLLAVLAHQAWLMTDAIGRSLIRLGLTRRHLLEWVTAAQATVGPRLDLAGFYRRMAGAPMLGVLALAIAVLSGQGTWPLAAAFAVLWISAPAIARWASQSPAPVPVSAADTQALRRTARQTWRFFETFVTPADNMLPPDNFQEDPHPVLAHRTSPTNIGLYLLAAAVAHDFGWAGLAETVARLEATLAAMHRLPLCHGHFYNWYDTLEMRPLDPSYVSSVDSGNLAGHLIALANTMRDWRERPPAEAAWRGGIIDAAGLAREAAALLDRGARGSGWCEADAALALLAEAAGPRPGASPSHLAALAGTAVDRARALAGARGDDDAEDLLFWAEAARRTIDSHDRDLAPAVGAEDPLALRLVALEEAARAMALAMDFGLLFDRTRKLLSIGYLVGSATLDPSCYDLLASEARLASFIAIAKGDVPVAHWFRLGRGVTPIGHGAALISWSGSMFEYLMPSLVMRAPAGSLIEQTSRLIVRRQIDYGASLGVPWGISESAYNARDLELTYQYSSFGVPGLGLKRGLGQNAVVAPYATALATMADPRAAVANLARLAGIGARGRYGFYEALDYTPARVPAGTAVVIVRAYMAHHQGMSIVAIADALLDGLMRTRFHAEPIVQASELLLQERTPRDVAVARSLAAETKPAASVLETEPPGSRHHASPHGATPATLLLSNGQYALMLTAAGSGYSRWRDLAITRWREDATCDDWGSYIYLRDVADGTTWSAGFQPSGAEPDAYGVAFKEDRAEFTRRDGSLTTTLEVLVSAEDAAEVRRVGVHNAGSKARMIEITSYAELALSPQAADVAHPAFAKLFVITEYLADPGVLLATRRRRSPDEPEIWAAHLAVVDGEAVGPPEVETDRARFLGRGRSPRAPVALGNARTLSGTVGVVLDPIFALRRRVRVEPGAIVRVAFWTMAASTRTDALDLADKHQDVTAFDRAAMLAWTQAQVQLHHIDIDPGEARLFQLLAGHLLYAAPALRPASDTIRYGGGAPPGLWSLGISGDLPILLLRIADTGHLDLVRQLLRAHAYWRLKLLAVDLVILNEHAFSYAQDLQDALEALVRARRPPAPMDGPAGGVFLLRADMIPTDSRALLGAVARVVLVGQRGRLSDQLARIPEPAPAPRVMAVRGPVVAPVQPSPPVPELEFFNGLGGFADAGREYVTVLGPGRATPAPWINVIANRGFGFQVSAEGAGCTWAVNSRENQITPWSNDPVTDRSGEAFYLRDADTGQVWSPTATPIRDPAAAYLAYHGRGYSRFTHAAHGIAAELLQYVPLDSPIKISRLRLRDTSGRARHLSLTAFAEFVLGPSRTASAPHVTTEIDRASGALFARNPWSREFGGQVAFLDLGGAQTSWTGDRRAFIGRNGTLASPAALAGTTPLSNTVGAGLDPCGALRTSFDLAAGGTVELVCFLGAAADAEAARRLIARYRAADPDAAPAAVAAYWDGVLGAIQVKTPDRAMDIMLNGWLLYQTLACRVWARSGFYQASGAYGFRDQLQDGMALATACPGETRAHLLAAAGRQFVEGDVQHWWLPHSGQGVRTRISDDRVWLAYTVAHYVETVGDTAVLDVSVPFLEGQRLMPGEHDAFFQPTVSEETATLFAHCARGLDASLALGSHGLPLIGTGDWNDGMNRVGAEGRGESVWLGWFLYATLMGFAPLADARGETARATAWWAHAAGLRAALDRAAWDGDWYRRAWFDDGTPLGTAAADACRIDSLAQSWAVLSGAADPARARRAMAALERELIRPAEGLALLLAPPFDTGPLDPGYIKGYPPGIRENGGQYTHAALWAVMAFAQLGEGDKAAALFSFLNPITHAATPTGVQRYKTEPYAVAADVYAAAPHVGRGGWSWYTGSAGWMQRAGVESILGLRLRAGVLWLDPCIPRDWPGFEMVFRHGSARYEIKVENPAGTGRSIAFAALDGAVVTARPLQLPLADDRATHRVDIRLG
ncbi:MAG: glycosyl transferase [Proteobacteria bacterium]|nr:glycosyl transferase [Pseudomonadota bacterium]